jgi:hypothetical protein
LGKQGDNLTQIITQNSTMTSKLNYFFSLLFIQACSSPTAHFDQIAEKYSFLSTTVKTQQFEHRIYFKPSVLEKNSSILHVYLDGDGSPWHRKKWISKDPTSRNPLTLLLMEQDNNTAIMLGRPCYHGAGPSKHCNNTLWTSHRYAKSVVTSMTHALQNWLQDKQYQEVILIGYSGGGSLAVLMAPFLDQVTTVLTVAANLDVAAWSRFHGYETLRGSLDPVAHPPLPMRIRQLHFAGSEDKIVPPDIIQSYIKKQKNAELIIVPEQNHSCCWQKIWPEILAYLQKKRRRF